MILTVTLNPAIDRVYFVDNLDIGEVNRPADMTYTAGGKGLNVSRVATLIGEKVDATGFVAGYNGQFICDDIQKIGIGNKFVQIDGETRICINITDRSNGKSTEVLEKGPVVSEADCDKFIDFYTKNISNYDVISISGSMPKGVPTDFYAKLVEIAKQQGKKIVVDTSGDALVSVIKAKPYMVKPNKYELSKYLGREISTLDDVKAAAKELFESGISFPVISLGKDGCIAYIDNKCYHFISPDVKTVNTVGSGDSFIAGVVAGLVRGMNGIDIMKLANACGTANTQFSQTGMVSKELVDKFFKEVVYTC